MTRQRGRERDDQPAPVIRVTGRVSQLLGEPEPLPIRLHGGHVDLEVDLGKTALLCVDMQEHLARPRTGPKAEAAAALGLEDELEYYWARLAQAVANLRRLQGVFRQAGVEVVHVRAGSLTRDRRDQGRKALLRAGSNPYAGATDIRLPSSVPHDSPIILELAPLENEVVIFKGGAGPFGITPIDLVLRNLGIEILVVGGVILNQCVEATVRGAFDHGFSVVLVDDACATYNEELRRATLRSIGDWFCKVVNTDEVLSWFATHATGAARQALRP